MKLHRILGAATLCLIAACSGDSPTGNASDNSSGTVSFTYSGGAAGSYNATGAAGQATTWAAGFKVSSNNGTTIVANLSRAGGLTDIALITMNRQTNGSGTIDTIGLPSTSRACNTLALSIGIASGPTIAAAFQCTLTSGTITVASITSSRATGNFSGSGTCFNFTTAATSAFNVTNGSFNVPLLANVPSGL